MMNRHNLFYAIIAAPRSGKTTFAFNHFANVKNIIWITPHIEQKERCKEAGFYYLNANEIKDKDKLLKLKNSTILFDDITATDLNDTRGHFLYKLAAMRGESNNDIIFISHGFNFLAPKVTNLLNIVTVGLCGDRKINENKVPIWFSEDDIERYKRCKKYEFFTVESGNLFK